MLEQYKEAIEKSNIVSKTDTAGIITFVNDEFCKISGYSRDELIGKNHNIIRDPSVSSLKFALLWDTIKAKRTYKSTVKNRAKNGTIFYVNTTVTPILDQNDVIEEYIAIRYDVTKEVILKKELEQKDLELEILNKTLEKRVKEQTEQLLQLNQTLEKRVAQEIKKNEEKQKMMFLQSRLASLGQMLANIAHQWRQPLTQLNLSIYSTKKEFLNNNPKDAMNFYNESKSIIQNMSNTIDDFTNFFKPEKNKKFFSLKKCIMESIQILDKIIKNEKIKIVANYKDIELLGIQNELSQVIINLIQNSKDAFIYNKIKNKKIIISINKKEDFVIINIEDNAGGIKEENIEKIFEPYFTTKHSSSGTGLGLFMSKMICEQGFNGTMDVKNKNNGIILSIKLPIKR